ncbi:MAG TPA: ELM1/GtrOC1 family putative glycosyltransferase [Hyphomicrobiaceae bacterium]|nr:ELM1/GtrOC1 family putative glycosyltransferase [Hyphomicrobiaceae bacterium]
MTSLPVLILSDGRPGHYHLAEGIAAAIARRRPVEIAWCEVRRRGWPGRLLALLVNRQVSPTRILSLVFAIDPARIAKPKLIISAGAETLAANICLARLTGAANIFYGSLRRFRPDDFALVLSSYAHAPSNPRVAATLKPSKLDPDGLIRARDQPPPGPGRPPRLAGLLIGGDAGAIRYGEADWKKLFGFLEASHETLGTRWIVSNSRRTAPEVSDAVHGWARRREGPIESFIDVRRAGAGSLIDVFMRAQAVLCTDDSSSMVSEAIWARLPVLGVRPQQCRFTSEEEGYRRLLSDNGWYRTEPIAALSPELFLARIGEISPMTDNPLDRLAGLLAARLPQIFDDSPG